MVPRLCAGTRPGVRDSRSPGPAATSPPSPAALDPRRHAGWRPGRRSGPATRSTHNGASCSPAAGPGVGAQGHHGALRRHGLPGITIRPFQTMHGAPEFCEVFFDDVSCPSIGCSARRRRLGGRDGPLALRTQHRVVAPGRPPARRLHQLLTPRPTAPSIPARSVAAMDSSTHFARGPRYPISPGPR